MTQAEATVDQVVPSKGQLFLQSAARSIVVAVVAKYFPDLAHNPSVALGIDFAVVFGVSLLMAWISSSSTRKHALNAALSIAQAPASPPPQQTIAPQ